MKPYRVITFNVLEGWRDCQISARELLPGSERRAAAYAWLASKKPAIVGLQELDRFTAEQLAEDATVWGHPYTEFLDCGCSIGVTSRSPIEMIEKKFDMHHGLLHVRIDGIDLFVTHFTPAAQDEDVRAGEIAIVVKRLSVSRAAGRPCVLMGDLNALSPQDDALMGEASRGWYPEAWPREDGGPSYATIRALLEAGWVDPLPKHRAAGLPEYPERPRYDFTLLSADLAESSVGAEYWQDEETGAWSDHWPVSVDLNWPV
jgi:exodeoxyribonuclease-3